jgi:hypothetical protein
LEEANAMVMNLEHVGNKVGLPKLYYFQANSRSNLQTKLVDIRGNYVPC